MLRRRGDSAHSLFLKLDGLSFIFGGVKFLSKLEKKNPKQTTEKNPKQTVASATCARERGVKEVRCVCCAVFCSNSSSSSCGRVCLPLSLSLLPLNTTDRDLEDTGRGIKLPIIVDFLSCLPHMGETGNVKFRPKSVVS